MRRASFIFASSSLLTANALLPVSTIADAAAPVTATGELILMHLPTAPYPHKSRHYTDDAVAVYIPPGYKQRERVDFVVHFHGWHNTAAHVLLEYRLPQQLDASGLNAILVVPQGPLNAADSGFGKLELDDRGFADFIADVIAHLNASGKLRTKQIGAIVLSAHSGGYGGAGGVLTHGGLNGKISDVLLFDAAYGYYDAFANWVKSSVEHHLLSVFTGDTATGNAALMGMVQGPHPNIYVHLANDMTSNNLETRAPTFILTTDVAHDELMQKYNWFELFLKATALKPR
ncbi:MAG: hypothetical protein M3Y21_05900 [Candidatus Eremiobacteraeota bacterium]|nr:hypothetical protein [Candidatus Eremiobacteraeota bacterium]